MINQSETYKAVSIIIPVFNEADNLIPLYERICYSIKSIERIHWSFVFINDASSDSSMDILRKLTKVDDRVKVVELARNFGKEIALTAGAHECENRNAIICIDADLQHPPELIPRMIEIWRNGIDIVVTIRINSEKQPILRRLGSDLFYWIINKSSSIEMVRRATDFRLYDEKVVRAFCFATERQRMFRGIMDWLGFRRQFIEFSAPPRSHGRPGYTYKKLWDLAIGSITSFSLWPLKLVATVGILITAISLSLLSWMLINYIFGNALNYTPLAIVVVVNTLLIGIVLIAIGLVAHYIGLIHTEVINRPLYVIREKIGI